MSRITAYYPQHFLKADRMEASRISRWALRAEGAAHCCHSVGHARTLQLRSCRRSSSLLRCRRKSLLQLHRSGGTRLCVTAGALPRIDLTMLPRLPDLGEGWIQLDFHDYATKDTVHILTGFGALSGLWVMSAETHGLQEFCGTLVCMMGS